MGVFNKERHRVLVPEEAVQVYLFVGAGRLVGLSVDLSL